MISQNDAISYLWSWERTHTNTRTRIHICMKVILRNQAHAGLPG